MTRKRRKRKKNHKLIVFAKNLIPNTAKTRVAADIGWRDTFTLYKKLVYQTIELSHQLEAVQSSIYYTLYPELEDRWPEETHFFLQNGSNLGARMNTAITEQVSTDGETAIALIGVDCPTLSANIIDETFEKLNSHDVVLGPSTDGGYYLIAMSRPLPQLFQKMRWSTSTVLQETLHRCKENGLSYYLLPPLTDIDSAEVAILQKDYWDI